MCLTFYCFSKFDILLLIAILLVNKILHFDFSLVRRLS